MSLLDEAREALGEEYSLSAHDIATVTSAEILEDELYEQTRWTTYSRAILKRDNEFISVIYGEGSTEMQEDDSETMVAAVRPKEKVVTIYESI